MKLYNGKKLIEPSVKPNTPDALGHETTVGHRVNALFTHQVKALFTQVVKALFTQVVKALFTQAVKALFTQVVKALFTQEVHAFRGKMTMKMP